MVSELYTIKIMKVKQSLLKIYELIELITIKLPLYKMLKAEENMPIGNFDLCESMKRSRNLCRKYQSSLVWKKKHLKDN